MSARRKALALAGLLLAERLLARIKEREPVDPDDTEALLRAALPAAQRLYRAMRRAVGTRDKAFLDDLPRPLRWLVRRLVRELGGVTATLERGGLTVREWLAQMRRLLAEHHLAGFMAGQGDEVVPDRAWDGLVEVVNVQLEYLKGFGVEVRRDRDFEKGYQKRAESYAEAIKVPYWQGKTEILPLPAMPAQGTQCGNNCGCKWDVKVIDRAKGDYDARWVRGKTDSCQTCIQRAREWNPVRIRDFELQI